MSSLTAIPNSKVSEPDGLNIKKRSLDFKIVRSAIGKFEFVIVEVERRSSNIQVGVLEEGTEG
jgi:hypothetical protein